MTPPLRWLAGFGSPLFLTTLLLTALPAAAQAQRFYYADSSVRLQVSPKEAEVYVDGYYAGRVDDFDGALQRLRLEPGGHEITLYLDGYRSVTQKVLLQPNGTFRVRETLQPLVAGDTQPARPVAAPRTERPERRERRP